MIRAYVTKQGKNRKICRAFAAGCGAKIVPAYPLLPDGDAFMFGALRGLLPTFRRALRQGRLVYGDNAYFRPDRLGPPGYYRVTRNAMQHDGSGNASPARWERLQLEIKPWRSEGSHVVVCPPARLHAAILDFDADLWLSETLATLAAATDRPIRVRKKMSWQEVMVRDGRPLAVDLRDAWALVTYSSNAAVEALLAGVPVFCTAPCAAYMMGAADVSLIEAPRLPDGREQWAWNLAAAQWTLAEMESGQCWQELHVA